MHKKGIYERFLKRPMDFILSLLAIIVLSPVLLIIAILVRAKLGSPVIFKQKRPGLNAKIFTLYKFRTMTDKKDKNGNLLSDSERLTKFGKILRSTSLDELPELINIIKGNMSIVGPRPLLIQYLKFYKDFENTRLEVRPGLTGFAQVNGRNTLSWYDRFKYDVDYVNSIGFEEDVRIIIVTFLKIISRKNIDFTANQTIYDYFKSRDGEI